MLKNYVTIALRNLRRHKGYAFINIGGLAVGIACCLLIVLYVQYELSYDTYHDKATRIYRVVETVETEGRVERSASVPFPLAPALHEEYPGLRAVRFFARTAWGATPVRYEDQIYNEPLYYMVDSTVFDVFDFKLIQGDPRTVLDEPGSLVITERAAKKYFGDEDPIGKVLHIEEGHIQRDVTVTGVAENIPLNSHFRFDFLERRLSMSSGGNWDWKACWTYVLLPDGADAAALAEQLPAFVDTHFPEGLRDQVRLDVQPLTRIHLYSDLSNELEANGNVVYLYIFSVVAFIILLLACINYMNLATARAARRAREVGMRKVVGAARMQLVGQFLGEALLTTGLALLFAVGLVNVLHPWLGTLVGADLPGLDFADQRVWFGLIGVTLMVGVLAGLYPAFVLSSFKPVQVLKGTGVGRSRSALWEGLVIFQFAATILLLIVTAVVFAQMHYIQKKSLGIDREQIVAINVPMPFRVAENDVLPHDAIRDALVQETNIVEVSMLDQIPWRGKLISRRIRPAGAPDALPQQLPTLWTDERFAGVFEAEIVAGRHIARRPVPDSMEAMRFEFMLNQAAVQKLGWNEKEAVGRELEITFGQNMNGDAIWRKGTIVGVLADFHYETLHHQIKPLAVVGNPYRGHAYKIVRLGAQAPGETLQRIAQIWERFVPEWPLELIFMDEDYARQYQSEQQLEQLFRTFAALAVWIACLGLFGLAAFMAEQRTKEIGIRKVLGASVASIVVLLSKDYLRLVLVAFLVGAPVAYFVMQRWLEDFAYRIHVGPGLFALAGLLAAVIALATVSYQAIRAALADPVESLRYE